MQCVGCEFANKKILDSRDRSIFKFLLFRSALEMCKLEIIEKKNFSLVTGMKLQSLKTVMQIQKPIKSINLLWKTGQSH